VTFKLPAQGPWRIGFEESLDFSKSFFSNFQTGPRGVPKRRGLDMLPLAGGIRLVLGGVGRPEFGKGIQDPFDIAWRRNLAFFDTGYPALIESGLLGHDHLGEAQISSNPGDGGSGLLGREKGICIHHDTSFMKDQCCIYAACRVKAHLLHDQRF
jgi:hypothetical protein